MKAKKLKGYVVVNLKALKEEIKKQEQQRIKEEKYLNPLYKLKDSVNIYLSVEINLDEKLKHEEEYQANIILSEK